MFNRGDYVKVTGKRKIKIPFGTICKVLWSDSYGDTCEVEHQGHAFYYKKYHFTKVKASRRLPPTKFAKFVREHSL